MKVILAKHAGFCFGVRRAVEGAREMAKSGTIYTIGELIHNNRVVERLRSEGVIPVASVEEVPADGTVVIRSHGVPPAVYRQIEARGLQYRDLTCPFVKRIHERVFAARGKYDLIVIVGQAAHPEVIGIKGWAGKNSIVAATPEDVETVACKSALVVCQTTIIRRQLDAVCAALREKVDRLEVFNSICETTSKRQEETAALSQRADAVVVVGDKHSSNTSKLEKIALKYCKNVEFIEEFSELLLEKYLKYDIICIVAGASTPDWIIREVKTHMSELEKVQEAEVVTEEVVAAAEPAEAVAEEAPVEAAEPAAETAEDEGNDFLAELEKTFKKIRRGQFINGVVVQVSDDEVCVNIGYKSDGIIRKEDLAIEDDKALTELFKPGDEIRAEVITLNDGEGNVRLSRKKVENQLKWKAFVEELDQEKVYSCTVTKAIKGGVLSKLEGYDAFIPASQLSLSYVEKLDTFVGQTLDVKIIDIDKRQKRFVLSHKDVLKAQAEEEEKKLFASFEKGAVVKGVVKRITDFGAFVDIGGLDGLLHITDISWVRIKHPKDVLTENQEIEVKILNIDTEKKKISLGYKQLQPKPWDIAPQKYLVGDVIEGKVVRITPFGAFVELEPTIDGLVHISQVANKRIEKVEDVLTIGQVVTAKVLEVNPERKRISLSIRALLVPEKTEEQIAAEKAEREEKKRRKEEEYSYVIAPAENATTSLGDLLAQALKGSEE